MFDPTIFDNLKVILEGAVYDLDLAGTLSVTGRKDLVDLSSMSRTYVIRFGLRDEDGSSPFPQAELQLETGLKDLAGELLSLENVEPGCSLRLWFDIRLADGSSYRDVCLVLERLLHEVWGNRYEVRHQLSFEPGREEQGATLRTEIVFGRRFDEMLATDIPDLVDHAVFSLQKWTQWLESTHPS